LLRIFSEFQPDWVIHLAAESHVDRSLDNANDFVITNIEGTYQLLDVSLNYWQSLPNTKKEIFRFLHVSTDEVFGALGLTGYFNEHSNYAPNSPYAATKASSDMLARAYYK